MVLKDSGDDSRDNEVDTALRDATNTSHSVKRLRLQDGTECVRDGKENKPTTYLATLRDEAMDSPKSQLNLRPCY